MAGIQYEIHGELYEFDEEPSFEMLDSLSKQLAPKQVAPKTKFADKVGNLGTDTLGVGIEIGGTPTNFKLGDLEAGVNMLTGFPGMMAGGLAGAGQFIASGGDIDKASETLESVSGAVNDRIQYEPKSARGKEAAEAFGWANQQLSQASGEIVSDLTGGSNAGQLAGSLGYDILSNLIPLSPAMKGKAKPKPTEVNATATRAKEIMAENKAKAEAPKPVEPTPDTGLPQLLPELEAQRAGMPPLLPEAEMGRALPPIEGTAPPVPGTRPRPAPETPLPETNPYMMSPDAPARPMPTPEVPRLPEQALKEAPLPSLGEPTLPTRKRASQAPETPLPGIDEHLLGERLPGMEVTPVEPITMSRGPRGKQRGIVDPSVFAEGFEKVYDLASRGLKLKWLSNSDTITGHKEAMVQVTNKKGDVVADVSVTPNKNNNLEVGIIRVEPEFRKTGLSDLIYAAMSKAGDIERSTNQTPAGKAMWERFQKEGYTDASGRMIPNNMNKALTAEGVSQPVSSAFIKAMKGQSGQIDINGGSIGKISDYINKVRKGKNTTSPLFDQEKKIAAMTKIPGMEMGAYIPKDVPWGDVKLDLRALPDLPDSSAWDMFIGSKEMAASLKRNPAMYSIGQWFTNARKRAELYDTVAIKPLERDIMKSVRKGEAASVMAVMKEESYAKARFTPEQLNELLSPSQVEVYNKLRAEFDAALAIQNRALQENGRKPITPHEAYISSRWGGQWRTKVVDKEGKVVWWIAEKSKAKAKHALEYLKANYPELDYDKSKVEYKNRSMGEEGKETLAGYREMLNILDEDAPLTQKLQKLYEDKLEKEGYRAHGHDKHFEPKSGTKGFHGERPWINDAADVRAFYESQLSYLRESHLWAEQQTAVANTKKMLYDKELQASHQNTLDWVRETARNEIGSDTAPWVRGMEHSLFKAVGLDPSSATKGITNAKGYFYSWKLGFMNLPFAAMSVAQPVFTIPHHTRLSDQGFNHNPIKTMFDSMTMTAATILPKIAGDAAMQKVGPVPYIPRLYKDAFKYMEANGIVNLNQYSDVGHVNRSPARTVLRDTVNWTITAPEKLARTTAFMGYVSHLDQSGKFKGDDIGMFQKAEELTNLSMANFHHTERAPVFNKAGLAGNALVTLQTFKINQLNQLRDFYKTAKAGEGVKPFASMLAIQITMAGLMGVYGMEQAEWMWKWLKKGLNEAGVYDEDLMEFSPKKWMLENMPSLLSMGVMSQVMGGKDYHSRLDQGTILDPTMAGMMPFVSDLVEQGKDVVTALADPTDEKVARAGYSMMPSSVKGAYEMNVPTMTGAPGQGDAFSADRPDEPLYKRTAEDKAARGIPFHGVPTLTEAREKTGAFKRRETEQLRSRQLAIQTEKFNAASRTLDAEEMTKAIRKVATLGGDWEALIDGQIAQLEKRATTADEKALLKATDPAATIQTLLKVKRQLEATKKLRENH